MSKNVFHYLMLFVFSFLIVSCSSTSRVGTTKKTVIERNSKTKLRKDITQYSKKFVGIPYVYGGKTPKTGFDCSGFTSYCYKKFDIEVSPGSKYQAQLGRRISPKYAKPGDLLFFGKRGKVTHVALVMKNTREGIEVIHSTSSKGIMIQNVTKSSYWKPKIMYARDILSGLKK